MFNNKKNNFNPSLNIKHPVQRGAGMDEGEDKPPFKHKKVNNFNFSFLVVLSSKIEYKRNFCFRVNMCTSSRA